MNIDDFTRIFQEQVAQCEKTLTSKGKEYAGDDRLSNFKTAAALQNLTPSQALGGMLAKHVVSIYDLIWSEEPVSMYIWDEKIGDAINYLFLLKAVVVEQELEKQNSIYGDRTPWSK